MAWYYWVLINLLASILIYPVIIKFLSPFTGNM